LQCVAVCCSVLQCVAVCCSVLQCVAVCCSVLQCVAVCMRSVTSVQKHMAPLWRHHGTNVSDDAYGWVMWRMWMRHVTYEVHAHLQCVAVCCSVLQCVAVLQYVAVQCVKLRHTWKSQVTYANAACYIWGTRSRVVCCSVLQYVAVCQVTAHLDESCDACEWGLSHMSYTLTCSVLQCVAVCCSVLQYVAVF